MTRLSAPLIRFLRREDGTVIAEAIVILPLLLWAYVALFVYWDAFRAQNTAVKASYTVADMVSRELNPITCPYITGVKRVFDYLMDSDIQSGMVVTSVVWNEDTKRHEVTWSEARGDATAQTTTSLQSRKNRLPNMSDGDTVIVVETMVDYEPVINVGVPAYTYGQFIVTRPRRAAAGLDFAC